MENLRKFRKAKKLTQKQLANLVGVTDSSISQYESGKKTPSFEMALKLAEALDCESADLVTTRSNTPEPLPESIIQIPSMQSLPLVGTVACGAPIFAEENIEEIVTAPENVHADFALRCKGDSMINARIFDGDIVYIRMQNTVSDGEIAAVLVDDDATLKRIYQFPDHIILAPENPQYRPIVFWEDEMNHIRILGKAIAFTSVIR